MKHRILSTVAAAVATFALVLVVSPRLVAADKEPLHEKLEPLRPFLGKTWRGEFKNSTPEKPQVDVSHWERALNGQAIRILHSINNGVYGGESLVFWDAGKKEIVYYYFTTAGFFTTGVMTIEGTKVTSRETVTGSADGVTEVKATTELKSDGTMHTESKYLKKGEWVPGHGAVYHEAPGAKVLFK